MSKRKKLNPPKETLAPSLAAIEKLQAELNELRDQVKYLQLQLAGATRRDAELSVENLQLKTMRDNMFKALGFEDPK